MLQTSASFEVRQAASGVLFETATDPPGFTLDESAAELGASLRLPPWMESARAHIEELLPPITLPVKAAPRASQQRSILS